MIYPQNFEQKIGFTQIKQLLAGKCLSSLGKKRVEEMTFSDNYADINRRLEQTVEFMRILQEENEFPSQYFFRCASVAEAHTGRRYVYGRTGGVRFTAVAGDDSGYRALLTGYRRYGG